MFSIFKRLTNIEARLSVMTKISDLEESREQVTQERMENLVRRIEMLESEVRRLTEKAEKYDNSVNQAMGLLRRIPGIGE